MATKSPRLPLKVRLLLAIHTFAVNLSQRSDGTLNRWLMELVDPKASSSLKPIKGVTTTDVTVDLSRNIWFRIFTPITESTNAASLLVIIYFHGGGFALQAPNTKHYDRICRDLVRQLPAVVVSVNYRLTPEHRYPSQYEDGFDSLKFIDDNKLNNNLPASADLANCYIAGDSAGGNIAHHVTLKACSYNFKTVKVKGLIAIQPFFGGEERTESEKRLVNVPIINVKVTDWFWKAFLPEGEGMNRDHEAVNVCGLKSVDILGLNFPRTLVIVGGFDPLSDWQKRYCDWLKTSGKDVKMIEYPSAIHGFYVFWELPETRLLVKEIEQFVHNVAAN